MWETTDPRGRRVVLTFEDWQHILEHRELRLDPLPVLGVVARPHRRIPGRTAGAEWFYQGGIGPSRWVKVVVHYEDDLGRIVTAFPRRRFP